MNLDEFLAEVSQALGTDPALIAEVRDDLLDLTKDVAHNAIRPAAPLSAFLVGLSLGQGATAEQIREQIAKVTQMVAAQAD